MFCPIFDLIWMTFVYQHSFLINYNGKHQVLPTDFIYWFASFFLLHRMLQWGQWSRGSRIHEHSPSTIQFQWSIRHHTRGNKRFWDSFETRMDVNFLDWCNDNLNGPPPFIPSIREVFHLRILHLFPAKSPVHCRPPSGPWPLTVLYHLWTNTDAHGWIWCHRPSLALERRWSVLLWSIRQTPP